MPKSNRQALLMTALTFLFMGYQLQKSSENLHPFTLCMGFLIPLNGLIFALNVKKRSLRVILALINLAFLLIMNFVSIQVFLQ